MAAASLLRGAVLLVAVCGSFAAKSLYDLAAVDVDGELVSLSKYRGSVSLVVNVASFCGLTKANYEELTALQSKYGGGGRFQVMAFPCNQFNSQEPKSNKEVKKFAQRGYGASFPLFAKTTVNPTMCVGRAEACGADSEECCPTNNIIYNFLKAAFDGPIQWNFEKIKLGKISVLAATSLASSFCDFPGSSLWTKRAFPSSATLLPPIHYPLRLILKLP